MGTDRITAAQIDASDSKSDGQISCLAFADAVTAQKTPAHLVVAHHINNDLYCEIFGDQPPSALLLESWIEDKAKLSTDFFMRKQTNSSTLHDGMITRADLDYLFHILEDTTGRADSWELMSDRMTPQQLSVLWDPSFGDVRAAAQKTKRKKDDLVCPTPTHQNDHVVRPQKPATTNPYTTPDWGDRMGGRDDRMAEEFRKAIEEMGRDDILIMPSGRRHDFETPPSGASGRLTKAEVDAFFREFDTPPAPKPAPQPFTRELTFATTQKDAGTSTERLRYTIAGDAITVEVIGPDGQVTRTLNVPAAKLPDGQISSPEGTFVTTNGRMVASIPAYAVLKFDGSRPSTDSALDMIEITWDAKGTGLSHNPYGVVIETFVAPESPSGKWLNGQSSANLDDDGAVETMVVHKLDDHHLANRSAADANGQSINPTGWVPDADVTDKTKPHARTQIHMSGIGVAVKK